MTGARKKPKIMLTMSELFTMLPAEEERRHLDLVRTAEGEGIEALFVSEHVVMGPSSCNLGLPENPRMFVGPGQQDPAMSWPSPLIKLAALSAVTSTMRLMAAAVIAPLRHPILLAKDLATLDLISEGRLTVLPSVSWQREEYEALQIPFEERGRRLDEHLAIWKTLFENTPASYKGKFYEFQDTYFMPKPTAGGPKIWIGGDALWPRTLQRIAKYADGLMLGFPMSDEHRSLIDSAMRAEGREFGELEITGWLGPVFHDPKQVANLDRTLEATIPAILDQGCDLIAVKPSCFIDDPAEMATFCRNIRKGIDAFF